ncbi:hypothetical protein LTR36_003458 [Oleoguttula mirabilis]|uniref:Uncharacterized protein n=1 Tax=Oleoguttula mirabilis TaxID=1507867 RepID=A0AAV9JJW0_9PEZI|nr:hypothetical protein LTR36_003458 [Oleoguttula mirabilis]
MATIEPTSTDEAVDTVKAGLRNLNLDQLDEVRRHLRELDNQQSPLCRSPRELCEDVYDLVAIEAWRDSAPSSKTLAGGGIREVRFDTLFKFANACRQLRAECAGVAGRLARLGMVVERFDPNTGCWETLAAGETKGLRRMSVWLRLFVSREDAMAGARECWLGGGSGEACGVVHFTGMVGMPARMARWAAGSKGRSYEESEESGQSEDGEGSESSQDGEDEF